MRPRPLRLALFVGLSAALACVHTGQKPPPDENAIANEIGLTFVKHLVAGEFEAAVRPFDAAMKERVSPLGLAQVWAAIQNDGGTFETIEHAGPATNGHRGVYVRTLFTRKTLILKIFLDQQNHIEGFFYEAADLGPVWFPPPYADGKVLERPIVVGNSPPLPGHLTLPPGAGPYPLAILVPGSGPVDEDETVGENKPFKDLALGLAARGVAVLRYEKRTHVGPGLPKIHTIQDEYFGSVADALAVARQTPEIDARRIVLVGHSEGGMLAPWLAKINPQVAGVAVLGATPRSMMDLVVEQAEQIRKLHPYSEPMIEAVAELRRERARVESPDFRPDEMILQTPGSYWLSLRGYDAVATAAALPQPLFIGQGSRDYNVSPTVDYPLWQQGLAHKPNVTFRLYPNLNHLFIPWGGVESGEDDAHTGHVAPALIDDLSAWISALPPRG